VQVLEAQKPIEAVDAGSPGVHCDCTVEEAAMEVSSAVLCQDFRAEAFAAARC